MHTFPDYAKAKALTDNGSEFKSHFAKRMTKHEVMHWKTYPKTPKMNAHCERFNRSIQESFVDYNEGLLFNDLALFNQKMSDWLVFYNTELPHLLDQLACAAHRISIEITSTVQDVLDQYRQLTL